MPLSPEAISQVPQPIKGSKWRAGPCKFLCRQGRLQELPRSDLRVTLALIPLEDFAVNGCKTLHFFPSSFFLADTSLFGARVPYLVVEERRNGHGLVRLGAGLATLPPVPGGCEVLRFEDLSPLTGPNTYPNSTFGVHLVGLASGRMQCFPSSAHRSLPIKIRPSNSRSRHHCRPHTSLSHHTSWLTSCGPEHQLPAYWHSHGAFFDPDGQDLSLLHGADRGREVGRRFWLVSTWC
jgi:hypothetical protein